MKSRGIKVVFPLIGALSVAACGDLSSRAATANRRNEAEQQAKTGLTQTLYSYGDEIVKRMAAELVAAESQDLSGEWLWSLAGCNCGSSYKSRLLKRLSGTRGVLPQALVPDVRDQIRSNPEVNALLELGGFGELLESLFANDEKITGEIRKGIIAKITQSLPGGTRLTAEAPFFFDGFPAFANTSPATPGPMRSFALAEQVKRWHLVLGLDNLWQGVSAPANDDHGLQALATMQLLMEWKYLFGLHKLGDGTTFGGLTIDVAVGSSGGLGPFDPREESAGARYLAGSYTIEFPESTMIDLALNGEERWTHADDPVALEEQAEIWYTAAIAFSRLRPAARGKAAFLFAPGKGLLPDNAHLLPLAFLPGMKALLNQGFIDRETRRIFAFASRQGGEASLRPLVRLAAALGKWSTELQNIDDAGLDDTAKARLNRAPPALTEASRLVVQTILARHVQTSSEGGEPAVVFVDGDHEAPMALAAESLAILIRLDQSSLPSPLLREAIINLSEGLSQRLNQAWERDGSEANRLSADGILWLRAAISALAGYPAIDETLPWRAALTTALDAVVTSWQERTQL